MTSSFESRSMTCWSAASMFVHAARAAVTTAAAATPAKRRPLCAPALVPRLLTRCSVSSTIIRTHGHAATRAHGGRRPREGVTSWKASWDHFTCGVGDGVSAESRSRSWLV